MEIRVTDRPTPQESADSCAVRAEVRRHAMLGSAFDEHGVLLVEQPGPWGRRGLMTTRFDTEVAGELERRARGVGLRLLAIRRPGRTPCGTVRRWILADCQENSWWMRWGEYTHDTELLELVDRTRPG